MLILDLWKLTVSNAIYSPFTYVYFFFLKKAAFWELLSQYRDTERKSNSV